MNKSEALAVLHEIYSALTESMSVTRVSLDNSQISHIFTGGYQLKMKCELDRISRDIIQGIMQKHQLYMKEQGGYITLLTIGD